MKTRIALLGQPNSGKSTVFNMLTGLHRHIGNWPGKTVEKNDGSFEYDGVRYTVTDLPGSYGLTGVSEEEQITASFIRSGQADLVCILIDASQLERSMYMTAEFAPLGVPAILLLNMMDVAKAQGKTIDARLLEQRLGIPVLPFVAAKEAGYDRLKALLAKELKAPHRLKTAPAALPRERGSDVLSDGDAKYRWIRSILDGAVVQRTRPFGLCAFDRIATAPIAGKLLTVAIILAALGMAMLIGTPMSSLGSAIPKLLREPIGRMLSGWGVHPWIVSVFSQLLPNVLCFSVSMTGYVFGVSLVLGLLEQIGFLARVAFQFDGLLSRIGLQGKAICPILMGFGCTVGGAFGTRVMDDPGQRLLTMAVVWAVPCSATWGVVPVVARMFFTPMETFLLCAAIILCTVLMAALAAWISRPQLTPKTLRCGMIMELPPYHRPHLLQVLEESFHKAWDIFLRSLITVTLVSLIFWALTFSVSGSAEDSLLYRIGVFSEPVTRAFGLGWQTFMGFLSAAVAKEAVLGTRNAAFRGQSSLVEAAFDADAAIGDGTALAYAMAQTVSKAEAAAFLFACTFQVPCVMALSATLRESHSVRWTIRFALFYFFGALLLAGLVYRIAALFL